MDLLHTVVGRMVPLVDRVLRPGKVRRAPETQARVEQALGRYALYQIDTCPFCIRVRWAMHRLDLPIRLVDTRLDDDRLRELIKGGGNGRVPCLRVDEDNGTTRWVYDSADIIALLKERFPAGEDAVPLTRQESPRG